MSKRDYEIIARVLCASDGTNHAREKLAGQFADALAADNPRFNRATFLRACGVTS